LGKRDSTGLCETTTSTFDADRIDTDHYSSITTMLTKRERKMVDDDDEVDVVGLTHVKLSDDDDDYVETKKATDDDDARPLDLSIKKTTTTPCRPSVIRNGFAACSSTEHSTTVNNANSCEPDVSEHFRRSLSGKHYRTTDSTVIQPTSSSSTTIVNNCSFSHVIVNGTPQRTLS